MRAQCPYLYVRDGRYAGCMRDAGHMGPHLRNGESLPPGYYNRNQTRWVKPCSKITIVHHKPVGDNK